MPKLCAFIDNCPDFTIRSGRVYWSAIGGGPEETQCMPIDVFRRWNDAGRAILADWDARDHAPIPFRKEG